MYLDLFNFILEAKWPDRCHSYSTPKILLQLVGHVIKGGGIAITGQEQRQLGGGFLEGPDAPKGSGGFLGEVTMVQLYKVALTAGKAYNDHRHHHSLKSSTTTEAPPPPPMPGKLLGSKAFSLHIS